MTRPDDLRPDGGGPGRPGRGVRPDGVEFLDDAHDGGADEDLPGGERRERRAREHRLRLELGAGAVVLGLALFAAHAITQHHDHRAAGPSASASPSSANVLLDPSDGRTAPTAALPTRAGFDPTQCPGLRCYTSVGASADVHAAIAAVFPTATVRSAETIRLDDHAHGDPLWYVEVVAGVDGATLTLQVQAHAAGDQAHDDANDDGSKTVTYYAKPVRQWFVRARVTAHSGAQQPYDELAQLVNDPRVLSLA